MHQAELDGRDYRPCSVPGCCEAGEYRAPQSREKLRSYIWFCLEHIRAYNKAWDYYADMDAKDIERHIRNDITWQRPTWPLGARGAAGRGPELADEFGIFTDHRNDETAGRDGVGATRLKAPEREALDVMRLSPPVTLEIVRERYRELVKQLHPDANGGDKRAEERLKLVNHAYTTLKNSDHLS